MPFIISRAKQSEDTIDDGLEDKEPVDGKGYVITRKEDTWFESQQKKLKEFEQNITEGVKGAGKSLLKGGIEGFHQLGEGLLPPTGFLPVFSSEKLKEKQERLYQNRQAREEAVTQKLDELLPTGEGFLNEALIRGGKSLPLNMIPGGGLASTVGRTLAGGVLGQGAEELGLPGWAQGVAEISAFLGPKLFQGLIAKGKHADIIKAGRDLRLSDAQIAPLLTEKFKQKYLSFISQKGEKTKSILSSTRQGLSKAKKTMSSSAEALNPMSAQQSVSLKNKFEIVSDQIADIDFKKIQPDIERFFEKGANNGNRLMNLWHKVNRVVGSNEETISMLKGPIKEALHDISPALSQDFEKFNNLYSRYKNIAKKLKPSTMEDFVKWGEYGTFISAIAGSPVALKTILLEKGARIGSRELLLNPRFKQLGQKFLLAVNDNKYIVAAQLAKNIQKEALKIDKSLKFEVPSEENIRENFGDE